MPFLAPVLGAVGGVSGAIGLGGSILGSIFGNRKSNLEKEISNKINPSMENLLNWAGEANRQQGLYSPLADSDTSKASNFYGGILSPNGSGALNTLLGGARGGVMANYQAQKNNNATFGPRGGGRTSQNADFGFAQNRDLMNLVANARNGAAQGLLASGGQAGQQALGYGNLASQNIENILRAAIPGQSQLAGQRAQSGAQWGDIGGQIGDILGPILGGLGKGRGGALPELVPPTD